MKTTLATLFHMLVVCSALAQPPAEVRALAEMAAAVRPEPRQAAWQRMEFNMFIHYGMNTFTDKYGGDGTEKASEFCPTEFHPDQWTELAAEAGMKGLVLVCKHHEGFCLWPTAMTDHSVKSSPWKEGKGDVVREVAESCRKRGLKFGVYLSLADLHEPTYGQSEKYNEFFRGQLRELLTNYGEVFEVWFDGYTPKDKGQVYDVASYYKVVRELQPNAVIFGRGPDVRWVGNEKGKPRASEWSVFPLPVAKGDYTWPSNDVGDDLGSLKRLEGAKELCWYPAETDVPNRKGWFYHAAQNDTLKSVDELLDCYYGAVGGNSLFLLNFGPDQRGLIPEADIARFREFVRVLKETFARNLAAGAAVSASASASGVDAGAVTDGRPETFWTTKDWEVEPSVVVTLPREGVFNVVMLQEHIESGQRIERFAVDAWVEADQGAWMWKEIGAGTTVGYKKLIRIPEQKTGKVRVRFLESRVRPTLAEFGLFRTPARGTIP